MQAVERYVLTYCIKNDGKGMPPITVSKLPTALFWDVNHSSHAVARRVKAGFTGSASNSSVKWLVWRAFQVLRDEASLLRAHMLVSGLGHQGGEDQDHGTICSFCG